MTPSIVSNNCWAGFVYQSKGLQYCSPFIGSLILPHDYLKLLSNLPHYLGQQLHLGQQLRFVDFGRRFPQAYLDDVLISFPHDRCEKEVEKKWMRRAERFNFDQMLVKFSLIDGANHSHVVKFCALNLENRLLLVGRDYFYRSASVEFYELENESSEGILNEWGSFAKQVTLSGDPVTLKMLGI